MKIEGEELEDLLRMAIEYANQLGATYSEARFQSDIYETTILKNGIHEVSAKDQFMGISVRVLYKNALGFAATNIISQNEVRELVERAIHIASATSSLIKSGITMGKGELGCNVKIEIKPRIKFDCVDYDSRIQLLKEVDEFAKDGAEKIGVKLPARMLTIDTLITEKLLITSDGVYAYSKIPRVAFNFFLTAYDSQKGTAQRYGNLGESLGWEAVERWDLPKLLHEESLSLSKVVKEAKKPPTDELDVILGPEVVGIVCHESCGHPSEADRILGREAAQAGETYLDMDSIGKRVGSEVINVVDDPTLPKSFGFYLYDDEGVKARKRVLIKNGVINEFLHNRETASVFNLESNASSRSVAYNREPIIRMANTFLEPKDYSFEELIKDVRHGVYIKNFMEWNIDDKRFHQRYVGLEAYQIENGELKEMVRNPVLELTTIGLWSAIDAVGKDLEFQAAYCGKGDPMQGIPVWTGGPHVRLRKVRLSGVSL
ncbi:MAG: TldD/PmbA family protein [Nitrososphaerales archaeon]